MWRLYVLIGLVVTLSGCAAFDDARKDLRGDNMQMRYNTAAFKSLEPAMLDH